MSEERLSDESPDMTRIFLAGAGPGDPDLLTMKTARLLREAEVVLHDSLVGPGILALINPDAELVDVGKRCGRASAPQAEICRLLVEYAQTGRKVVRLKGGDPVIFGRLTEEMEALRAAGFSFEVVPGITAASAAAAGLELSLTQRRIARSLHIITGHGADAGLPAHDWGALARAGGSFAIYMGSKHLPGLVEKLLDAGMAPELPALAVESASLPAQRVLRATLASLAGAVARAAPSGPVLVLVGEALG
ncbi:MULTISPECIES: uroporphyrinogen-III C-methyltransferase [unclassified Acidocella]|uniref:uroporphyrinogen-III C-methyltransferase n=1 Tax=unclassified Acidocella TaxID=2648610 RepID=UPI001F08F6C8|nr:MULTISPECIES: uroporphyrinogen-III C-methyltransferase [unclassified Acidocella]WBO59689.1 uroporphyrinogen-III C-methyltransferase [Acidocella sp. MX-AZ03]